MAIFSNPLLQLTQFMHATLQITQLCVCVCDCNSGSRRVFGTVVETSCIFLIDISGSMDLHMDELRKELVHLVWEQLHKHNVRLVNPPVPLLL